MMISIITVVLNDPAGLRLTAESIAMQSSSDFEWIIIDGASSDDTISSITSLTKINPIICSEKDDGIYDAMNKGVKVANGEYLIFMNAGDSFANQFVIEMLEHSLDCGSVDVLLGGTCQCVNKCVFYRAPKDIRYITKGLPAFHQSIVYRKRLLDTYQFNLDYVLLADYEWLAAQCVSGLKVGYLNEPVSNYQVGGLSYTNINKKFFDMFSVKYNVLSCSRMSSLLTALLAIIKTLLIMNVLYRFCRLFSFKSYSRTCDRQHASSSSESYKYIKVNHFVE